MESDDFSILTDVIRTPVFSGTPLLQGSPAFSGSKPDNRQAWQIGSAPLPPGMIGNHDGFAGIRQIKTSSKCRRPVPPVSAIVLIFGQTSSEDLGQVPGFRATQPLPELAQFMLRAHRQAQLNDRGHLAEESRIATVPVRFTDPGKVRRC